MTTDNPTPASGQNPTGSAGGDDPNANPNPGSADDPGGGGSGDSVSYDTHRRLLSEKKKEQQRANDLQKQLDERAAADKAAEEKRLHEQGEFKKIAELRAKEAEEAKAELERMKENQNQARKLDAVLQAAGGNIPRKFWPLIDISGVAVNPETGLIDDMSVTKTVEQIRAEYPEIIKTAKGNPLPADAPQGSTGNGSTPTPEEWKTLSAEEQKKHLPQYVEALKARLTTN